MCAVEAHAGLVEHPEPRVAEHGDDHHDRQQDRGDDDRRPQPDERRQDAADERADRRAGEEAHHVDRQHAAAVVLVDVHLHRGLARHHGEALREPDAVHAEQRERVDRRQAEGQLGDDEDREADDGERRASEHVATRHRDHRAGDRADAVRGHEQPVLPRALVQHLAGERLRELDHRHAEQRREQRTEHRDDEHRALADVAERVAELREHTTGCGAGGDRAGRDQEQSPDDEQERCRVGEERGAGTELGQHEAGERGPEAPAPR